MSQMTGGAVALLRWYSLLAISAISDGVVGPLFFFFFCFRVSTLTLRIGLEVLDGGYGVPKTCKSIDINRDWATCTCTTLSRHPPPLQFARPFSMINARDQPRQLTAC